MNYGVNNTVFITFDLQTSHCVTYRRPALSLSKQFLLHGLFIKLFTSFHIDSAMLNRAADQESYPHYRSWVDKLVQYLQMWLNR